MGAFFIIGVLFVIEKNAIGISKNQIGGLSWVFIVGSLKRSFCRIDF